MKLYGEFGKTFGDEILSAGLGGKKISWSVDFIECFGLTEDELETLENVVANHNPKLIDPNAEFSKIISEALPSNVRASVNSYILRLSRKATTSAEEKYFLSAFDAADLWEEAMINERDAAIKEKRNPSFPQPPASLEDLINACK